MGTLDLNNDKNNYKTRILKLSRNVLDGKYDKRKYDLLSTQVLRKDGRKS